MRILCMGDSIMQYNDCTTYPQTGWVQLLVRFFPSETVFLNFARNGRSTKSFIDEGRFTAVCEAALPGDFVLIQFGHNDEKSTDPQRYTNPEQGGAFRSNLIFFIETLRKKGAFPILLTPMARRKFLSEHAVDDTHGLYSEAVITVAAECKVPVIDMNLLTRQLLSQLGESASRSLFMNFGPHVYDNYPEGKDDNSHLRSDGAYAFSRIAAHKISEIGLQWTAYRALSDAVIDTSVDHSVLDREISDEKAMA